MATVTLPGGSSTRAWNFFRNCRPRPDVSIASLHIQFRQRPGANWHDAAGGAGGYALSSEMAWLGAAWGLSRRDRLAGISLPARVRSGGRDRASGGASYRTR